MCQVYDTIFYVNPYRGQNNKCYFYYWKKSDEVTFWLNPEKLP
jgi:hypothetical protein